MNSDKKRAFYKRWFNTYGNFKCHYCRKDTLRHLEPGYYQHNRATIDHIVPRCLGGDNKKENLVLACEECNCKKSILDQQKLFQYAS